MRRTMVDDNGIIVPQLAVLLKSLDHNSCPQVLSH